jgi:hypothetical protein
LRIDLVGSHLKKVLHVGSTNETWFSKILKSVFEKLKIEKYFYKIKENLKNKNKKIIIKKKLLLQSGGSDR